MEGEPGNLYEPSEGQNGKTKLYEDFGLSGTLVRVDAIFFHALFFSFSCYPCSILFAAITTCPGQLYLRT